MLRGAARNIDVGGVPARPFHVPQRGKLNSNEKCRRRQRRRRYIETHAGFLLAHAEFWLERVAPGARAFTWARCDCGYRRILPSSS